MRSMQTGIAASPGIAIGRAFVLRPELEVAGNPEGGAAATDPVAEQARFEGALAAGREELRLLRDGVARRMGEADAAIFDAHLMMMGDPALTEGVAAAIRAGASARAAVDRVIAEHRAILQNMDDAYIRERAADVADVGRRLIRHLTGDTARDLGVLGEARVIVAHDLTPSETAQLDPQYALGFATESGGRTSHSVIMAQSLGIPAVVGSPDLLAHVADGDLVILDGYAGEVWVNPNAQTLAAYRTKVAEAEAGRRQLLGLRDFPAVTVDGRRIELAANLGRPRDLAAAVENGAEGVGLYRTEFLFMDRTALPTEEEQVEAYKSVAEGMGGRPVIIRTLDIGGDKQIPYLEMPLEPNPFLGWRAVRICLDRPELFKTQLRAIWRAGVTGNVRVMFPMISGLEELRRAKALLVEAREELASQGEMMAEQIPVGVMIELPSAALMAEKLGREVDFFSIGSNDLTQYTLGVDRMNSRIARLYDPLHPAVLRLIQTVVNAAHGQGKWVGICGEIAGEPGLAPLLLGIGLDELSMSAQAIPLVKRVVCQVGQRACRAVAERALEAETAAEVRELLRSVSP